MSRKILLACGIASSAIYLAMDIFGSLAWEGYSYIDQTVSELAALDAPSRRVALALGTIYNVLLVPFAIGVARSAERRRDLRIVAAAVAAIGMGGLLVPLFPIQMRGVGVWTINETMHVTLTAITVVLIVVAMAFSARALGDRFFVYATVSIAVTLLAGAIAGMNGANLAANLPTPWMGVMERLSIFTYLAWVVTLAVVLMRLRDSGSTFNQRGLYASR